VIAPPQNTLGIERRLDAALYLEGVRTPFIRATFHRKINSPVKVTIDLAPIPSALMIRPLSAVHLFYWDEPFIPAGQTPEWRLFFEGVTSSPGIEKSEAGTAIQIPCEDLMTYYRKCYQYFVTGEQAYTSSAYELAMFTGNTGINGKVIFNQPVRPDLGIVYNTIIRGMVDQDSIFDPSVNPFGSTYRTPFTGLLRTIQYIGNSSARPNSNTPGVNRFFIDAEKRFKLMQRIFFFQDLKISRLMSNQALQKILERNPQASQISSLTGIGSIWDLCQRFLSAATYDAVPLLAPPYRTNPSRDANGMTPPNVSGGNVILSHLWRPKCYFLPPPTCNLLFLNRFNKLTFRRNALDEPTRLRTKIHLLPGRGTEGYQAQPGEWTFYAPKDANDVMSSTLSAEADSSSGVFNSIQAAAGGELFARDEEVAKLSKGIKRSYGSPFPGGQDFNGDRLISDPFRDIFEAETGIHPMFNTLDSATHQFISEAGELDTIDPGSLISGLQRFGTEIRSRGEYLLGLGEYTLDVARSENRTLIIGGPFNPNILLGFSGAAIDVTGIYFGEFDEAIDVLSGSSSEKSTTTIIASHPRAAPVPPMISYYSEQQLQGMTNDVGWGLFFNGSNYAWNQPSDPNSELAHSVFYDPIGKRPWAAMIDPKSAEVYPVLDRDDENQTALPPYLNDLYRPRQIGASIYQQLGSKSIYDLHPSFTTQTGACIALLKDYLLAVDKDLFVMSRTTRSGITTRAQVQAFYNNGPGRKAAGTRSFPAFSNDIGNAIENEELFSSVDPPIFASVSGVVFGGVTHKTTTKRYPIEAYAEHFRFTLGKLAGVNTPESVNDTGVFAETDVIGGVVKLR